MSIQLASQVAGNVTKAMTVGGSADKPQLEPCATKPSKVGGFGSAVTRVSCGAEFSAAGERFCAQSVQCVMVLLQSTVRVCSLCGANQSSGNWATAPPESTLPRPTKLTTRTSSRQRFVHFRAQQAVLRCTSSTVQHCEPVTGRRRRLRQ